MSVHDEEHDAYMAMRVVDAFLREDIMGCASRSVVTGDVLLTEPTAGGRLRIPVRRSQFMQRWRVRELPVVHERDGVARPVRGMQALLDALRAALGVADEELFEAFRKECATAIEHRSACEAERDRWFSGPVDPASSPAVRFVHWDRLAAFLDHPFYPTARAKLGLTTAHLEQYTPEFQPSFELRWLALPKTLARIAGALPAWWPSPSQLELAPGLDATHVCFPVHPHFWEHDLPTYLAGSPIAEHVVLAPKAFRTVTPTLSVRTVACVDDPRCHIKVPLCMRTLGAKNIRTIKPSTVHDGHVIQQMLGEIAAGEPTLKDGVVLTDESTGGYVDDLPWLAFIVRRYPADVENTAIVPVAAFLAPSSSGGIVFEDIANTYFGGNALELFDAYIGAMFAFHLRLWIRYGIALESNQQNSAIVLQHGTPKLRLLLRDNDAARVRPGQHTRARTEVLRDRRIVVDGDLPLAQMFITITLQLCVTAIVEGLLARGHGKDLYRRVRHRIEAVLHELEREGDDVSEARKILLEAPAHPLKLLLVAATLRSKQDTGVADVNKYYGHTAPNSLRDA